MAPHHPVKKPDKKDIVDEVKEEVRKELEKKREEETVKGPEDSSPPGIPFINYSRLKFIDVSSELFREYLYPNGAKITIQLPLRLSIAQNNAHRVFDSSGLSYYIPPNWIGIVWKAKPGAPNFIM